MRMEGRKPPAESSPRDRCVGAAQWAGVRAVIGAALETEVTATVEPVSSSDEVVLLGEPSPTSRPNNSLRTVLPAFADSPQTAARPPGALRSGQCWPMGRQMPARLPGSDPREAPGSNGSSCSCFPKDRSRQFQSCLERVSHSIQTSPFAVGDSSLAEPCVRRTSQVAVAAPRAATLLIAVTGSPAPSH